VGSFYEHPRQSVLRNAAMDRQCSFLIGVAYQGENDIFALGLQAQQQKLVFFVWGCNPETWVFVWVL